MATLTVQEVRDVAHWSIGDLPTAIVETRIGDAVAYVNSETGLSITYTGTGNLTCTTAEKPIIKMLAALYCLAYTTGGSGFGMHINVGEMNVQIIQKFPALDALLDTLDKGIRKLKYGYGIPFKAITEPID
jgi:hypothetical protein